MRVVIFVPGHNLALEMRRTLLHCTERGHTLMALAVGEHTWPSVVTMVQCGEADLVVTTARSGHTTGSVPIEIAGAGRTTLRTPGRAARLRRIAELVDSGLSTEMIVRMLRHDTTRQ